MKITRRQIEAAVELSKRKQDGLSMFRAMPHQEEFFRSVSSEELVRGGNRSGKSTVCAVRFAAIARDKPIYLMDGSIIPQRRDYQKNKQLLMWVIGIQLNHIGATIHRLLFRPGLYKIIRDEKSQEWRAFRPWSPEDKEREDEVKDSWPLIPPSEIESFSWERRGDRQFNSCILKNGTEIQAYASTAEVKAGDPVDQIWIDEAIKYPQHVPEWQARLSDKKGRLLWSSWPTISNPALRRMTERAEENLEEYDKNLREELDVREFVYRFSDNPYIDANEKRKRLEGWSEDERRARDKGEYITDSFLIYPTFSKRIHAAYWDDDSQEDELSETLRERNGEPPQEWTRELVLDPGTSKPGVLFCAVPPPEYGNYLVVYDEIYSPRLDADQLADRIFQKARGYYFERFIIDSRAGRQTAMGFGKTVQANYSRAFAERNLTSRQTGNGFTAGVDDELARIMMVQNSMTIRANGKPRLRLVTHRVPHLIRQLETNVKTLEMNEVTDKPAKGQKDDLRACLEYWISRTPQYVPPLNQESIAGPGYQAWKNWKKIRQQRHKMSQSESVNIGPGEVA